MTGRGVALVTGGVRRIGRALAEACADAGYDVAVHHRGGPGGEAAAGAIAASLNDPAVKEKLLAQGFEIVANTPEQFGRFQATEYARWKQLIETRKITAD